MIKLHQFSPAWGIPNPSPFCLKVETYLRMVGLEYQTVVTMPMKAPKGKLPFIEDGDRTVADSTMILSYLKATYGDPLDAGLSPSERALAHTLQRMLDENTYWVGVYSRWFIPDNWQRLRELYFGRLPPVIRTIVPVLVRRRIWKQIYGQGLGRHSPDEIQQIGIADLNAFSDLLGDKPFCLGERPTSVDACAYAYSLNLLECPLDSALSAHAQTLNNLQRYCERMTERFFADYVHHKREP